VQSEIIQDTYIEEIMSIERNSSTDTYFHVISRYVRSFSESNRKVNYVFTVALKNVVFHTFSIDLLRLLTFYLFTDF